VVQGNPALEADPGLVNRDPYGEGWLFKLKIEDGEQVETLMEAARYRELISGSGKYEV
jgi:glycine cleavage system H protein